MFFLIKNDGKFDFQFSPEDSFNSYTMGFEKRGYCYSRCPDVPVPIDKEMQYFNIALEK